MSPPEVPPCPDTPNCARESATFPIPTETLRSRALAVLEDMGARAITTDTTGLIHAEFRVVIFTDDVHLAVTPDLAGSLLTIRSASRVGRGDLGVNTRRVRRFWTLLEESAQR